jgi:hypothetical protein
MKNKILGTILVTLSLISISASSKTLNYISYDTKDHQAIFQNNWKINSYKTKADFIKSNSPSANLVIFSPGWGGSNKYKSAFKNIAKKLGKNNHYLYLSHPDAVETAGRTVSIYQGIKAVKKTGAPFGKVIVIGASGGAQEAIHTTHSKISNALAEGNKVDAAIGFYPSCRVTFSDKTFDQAKVLMLLGGKDKSSPAKFCHALKNNGGLKTAEIIDYPEAGHSWLFKKSQKYTKTRTWQDCTLEVQKSGVWASGNLNSIKGTDNFISAMSKKCTAKVKMLTGRNNKVYKQSIEAAVKFINAL